MEKFIDIVYNCCLFIQLMIGVVMILGVVALVLYCLMCLYLIIEDSLRDFKMK